MHYRSGASQKPVSTFSATRPTYSMQNENFHYTNNLPKERKKKSVSSKMHNEFKHFIAATSAAEINQNTIWAGFELVVGIPADSFELSRYINIIGTSLTAYGYSKLRDRKEKTLVFDAIVPSIFHGLSKTAIYYGVGVRGWDLAWMSALSFVWGSVDGIILGRMIDGAKHMMGVKTKKEVPQFYRRMDPWPKLLKQGLVIGLGCAAIYGSLHIAHTNGSSQPSETQPKEISKPESIDEVLHGSTINWFDANKLIK